MTDKPKPQLPDSPIPLSPDDKFDELVKSWKAESNSLIRSEFAYTLAWGKALLAATGKTEAHREAECHANSEVVFARGRRDTCRIDEQAARWRVQWHLARAGREGRFSP